VAPGNRGEKAAVADVDKVEVKGSGRGGQWGWAVRVCEFGG